MRKYIEKPRVLLLDAQLEYKKANSMMNVELTDKNSLNDLLTAENDFLHACVLKILAVRPDIVITEKGVADQVA